jgi:hypothetical protein
MVAGPVVLVMEAVIFLLARGHATRALLAAAMLMDLVLLGIFALNMTSSPRY